MVIPTLSTAEFYWLYREVHCVTGVLEDRREVQLNYQDQVKIFHYYRSKLLIN